MHSFSLDQEQQWDAKHHVEKILGRVADGDVTVACWEPGQISPYHCHPQATEIYFCHSGGGTMRTPSATIAVIPGAFVVQSSRVKCMSTKNGPARTLLFRVRYGADMRAHHHDWRGNKDWRQSADDADYYRRHPVG